MSRKDEIIELIYGAIDVINDTWCVNLEKSPETPLYGEQGKLDSVGLVSLIVAVEESVEEKFNTTMAIADERAMGQKKSPFRTIGTLSDYISLLLEEDSNG